MKQTELSGKLRCASGSQHVSFLTSICRVLASEVCDKKAPLLTNSFSLLLMGGLTEEEEGQTVEAVGLESNSQAV